MDKLVPAVFLQKQLDSKTRPSLLEASINKPLALELYEADLKKIVGGDKISYGSDGKTCVADKETGTTTYSGSLGWFDVAQQDDCTITVHE